MYLDRVEFAECALCDGMVSSHTMFSAAQASVIEKKCVGGGLTKVKRTAGCRECKVRSYAPF